MEGKKRLLWPVLVLAVLALERGAHALSASEEALAEALFQRGYAAREAGHIVEAREDFWQSYQIDHASGTMLNVAWCDKKLEHMATAWHEFLRGAAEARKNDHDDWADDAEREAARIEPSLPRLILHLEHATDADHRRITLDGAAFPEPMTDAPMPVNPGNHRVEATALGKRPWATTFAAREQAISIVTVPTLEPEIAVPVVPRPVALEVPLVPPSSASWELALGIVGGASALAATALTVSAYSTYQGAGCTTACTTSAGRDAQDRAWAQADVATGLAVVGAGAIAGAAIMWLLDPARAAHVEVRPTVGGSLVGLSVQKGW